MLLRKQELQEAMFVSLTCFVMKSVVSVNKQEAVTCRIARSSEILTCQDSFHFNIFQKKLLTKSIMLLSKLILEQENPAFLELRFNILV